MTVVYETLVDVDSTPPRTNDFHDRERERERAKTKTRVKNLTE